MCDTTQLSNVHKIVVSKEKYFGTVVSKEKYFGTVQ